MATRDVLNHDNRSDIHTLKMHSNTLKGAEHYRHSTPIASLEFTYKKKRPDDIAFRRKPPKLKRFHYYSVNEDSQLAKGISFEGKESNEDPTETYICYDTSENVSYYDKCLTTLEKLGEGSFGTVFKARSKMDGELYAIKVTELTSRSELYRLNRLEEVRYYEKFSNHENCIRLYKAWEENNCLYMQMELCRENLEQYLLRKRSIPEVEIWSILYDVLMALKCLHDRNLIHLDIKLNNILISQNGTCKLGDFGIVTSIEPTGKLHTSDGDSRYMAPELLNGTYTKSADIFSLGITLFELASFLELPGNGPLWHQLRQGQIPYKYINGFSSDLRNLIKLMMSPQPSKRPSIEQLLKHPMLLKIARRQRCMKPIYKIISGIRTVRHMVGKMMSDGVSLVTHYFICLLIHLKILNTTTPMLNVHGDKNMVDMGRLNSSRDNDGLCFASSRSIDTSLNKYGFNPSLIKSLHNRSCLFRRSSMQDDDEDDFVGNVLNSTLLYPNDNMWKENTRSDKDIETDTSQKTPKSRTILEEKETPLVPRRLNLCSPHIAKKLFSSDDSDHEVNS